MSKDLIQALERINAYIERRKTAKGLDIENVHGFDGVTNLLLSDLEALSRHRSSVESVELPEGVRAAEARAVMNDDTIVYTAFTVRSLIAAAVERERERCAKVCEEAVSVRISTAEEAFFASAVAKQCAAAIREGGK